MMRFFWDVVATHIVDFDTTIGGTDDIRIPIEVEIDESQIFKEKAIGVGSAISSGYLVASEEVHENAF